MDTTEVAGAVTTTTTTTTKPTTAETAAVIKVAATATTAAATTTTTSIRKEEERFEDKYQLRKRKILGRGGFSIVRECVLKQTLPPPPLPKQQQSQVYQEEEVVEEVEEEEEEGVVPQGRRKLQWYDWKSSSSSLSSTFSFCSSLSVRTVDVNMMQKEEKKRKQQQKQKKKKKMMMKMMMKKKQQEGKEEQLYAVKCVARNGKLSSFEESALLEEVKLLQQTMTEPHDHIIRLYDFYIESNMYYTVLEHVKGGDLLDYLLSSSSSPRSKSKPPALMEQDVRTISVQLLQAVQHLHRYRIVHRDIKPENVLVVQQPTPTRQQKNKTPQPPPLPSSSSSSPITIKLADFGLAKQLPCIDYCDGMGNNNTSSTCTGFLTSLCGSLGYMAPEILARKPYQQQVDIWSVGVLIYVLLYGSLPMYDPDEQQMIQKSLRGHFTWKEPKPDTDTDTDTDTDKTQDNKTNTNTNIITPQAKHFIKQLLLVDPLQRFTASQALQEHPWTNTTTTNTTTYTATNTTTTTTKQQQEDNHHHDNDVIIHQTSSSLSSSFPSTFTATTTTTNMTDTNHSNDWKKQFTQLLSMLKINNNNNNQHHRSKSKCSSSSSSSSSSLALFSYSFTCA